MKGVRHKALQMATDKMKKKDKAKPSMAFGKKNKKY